MAKISLRNAEITKRRYIFYKKDIAINKIKK